MSNISFAPTTIDLSRAKAPDAIEVLDVEVMLSQSVARFAAAWEAERALDPSLPPYDTLDYESDTVRIVLEAETYLRYLDRIRVNDAIRSVIAPLARGSNLDAVVSRMGVSRLVVTPANPETGAAAVYETDAQLLRRYLLSFDRPSAGSAARYLYEAYTAWPGMLDARVNGWAVHGRRGYTDIVIIGPGGRAATDAELATVQAAVTADHVKPEAVGVAVLRAVRNLYAVDVTIEIPSGPDGTVVGNEAAARVRTATDERTLIGGEVPISRIEGAPYGPNVIRSLVNLPAASIASDPYTVPVCEGITVRVEARQ